MTKDQFDFTDALIYGEYSEKSVRPEQDETVTELVNNGVKVIYCIVFNEPVNINATFTIDKPGPYSIKDFDKEGRFRTEEEIQRYLDYVRYIVHHFKDRIKYYQILNEPRNALIGQYVRPEDYVNLVRRVIPVIRDECPDAKIVVGSVNGLPDDQDSYEYLLKIINSDIMPLVDGISFHPKHDLSPVYGTLPWSGEVPKEVSESYYKYFGQTIQQIKNISVSNGFKGEYICEGPTFTVLNLDQMYSEIVASKYLGRSIIMHLFEDIKVMIPSEGLLAVPNLCNIMEGASPSDVKMDIQSNATNIKRCGFSFQNGDTLVALWTDGIAVEDDPGIKSTLIIRDVSVQDVIGIDILNSLQQSMKIDKENGNLTIRNLIVRDYPLILRLTPVAKPPIITDLTITPTEVKTKQPLEINVIVTNTEGRERNYTIPLTINGSKEDTETLTLGGGQNGALVFRVMEDSAGSYVVKLGNLTGVFTVIAPRPAVILLSHLQITKATVKPGEEVEITAKLENVGELPGNYTIIFTLDGIEKGSFPITLDGGATITKKLKISSDVVGEHQISVGGQSVTFEVEKLQTGIPGYPYESVLIGLVLIVTILSLQTFRRSSRKARNPAFYLTSKIR